MTGEESGGSRDGSRPVMTTNQVAEAFRVDPRTVHRWVKKNLVRISGKRGRNYLFDENYIRELLGKGD